MIRLVEYLEISIKMLLNINKDIFIAYIKYYLICDNKKKNIINISFDEIYIKLITIIIIL